MRSSTPKPQPEPNEKLISRRRTLGAVSVLTIAGFSAGVSLLTVAAGKKIYASAAISESLSFEPEPGSPLSG